MARKNKEEVKLLPSNNNILLEDNIDKDMLKKELEHYIDDRINTTFINELDKANKRLIREKSRKIIWKNVVILILLAIIGFLLYLLFSNNYFDKYFNSSKEEVIEKEKKDETKNEDINKDKKDEVVKPTPSPTPKVPTLDELKKEYGSLINNYYLSDLSIYINDFYSGNLSNDLKKYLTLNSFDFDSLKKEDDYQIISASTFKIAYEKLFDDTLINSSFDYDNHKIRYVSMMESYMTDEILKKDESKIVKEIKDILVDDDIVKITTIEGIIKEDKLYEIVNNNIIDDYKGDSIINYQDKLNKVIYTFKNGKLIKLDK